MKIKEIITWFYVYPNWKTNFDSKNFRKTSFSYKTNAWILFIARRRKCLWCPIVKRKKIIMWIHVYTNWKMNFDSKSGRKWSFSFETKVSIIFIPMSKICLWCPMMKRKEIIMSIQVYPNSKMNFDSKNGRNTSFSYETKVSISYITIRKMCL